MLKEQPRADFEPQAIFRMLECLSVYNLNKGIFPTTRRLLLAQVTIYKSEEFEYSHEIHLKPKGRIHGQSGIVASGLSYL